MEIGIETRHISLVIEGFYNVYHKDRNTFGGGVCYGVSLKCFTS